MWRLVASLMLLCLSLSCGDQSPQSEPIASEENETQQMVQELAQLVQSGQPEDYYHWNSRMAAHLKQQAAQQQMPELLNTWFSYCIQLLLAGQSQQCIDEIQAYLTERNRPVEEQLNEQNQELFELLALAYLRLGEQQNCQQHHSPQSCIVPIQGDGQHHIKTGSQQAIEYYSLLYKKFPQPTYKWLLNVAYMTLGLYPNQVPAAHLIEFPHASEQLNFPAFEDIAMQMGVAQDGLSGGVCADDFNQDGFIDLFMTSHGMSDNVELYLNDQKGSFQRFTKQSGLQGIVSGLNCVHADYDNDGLKDILVLRGAWLKEKGNHPNSLLKNMGNGHFQDITRSSGLISYHPTQTAAWADFDKDGDLDLFIGNESTTGDPHPCELFLNQGNGTFREIAQDVGLGQILDYVKGVAWGDVDNDGWQDLYISILGGNNLLFKNEDGKFIEIAAQANVQKPFDSFPCWFWDVNNDGWEDIFVSSYDMRFLDDMAGLFALEMQDKSNPSEMPCLYINQQNGTFSPAEVDYGLLKVMYSMGANYGDIDNDGFLDFYIGSGAPDFSTIIPNRMFRNIEGRAFEEVSSAGGFGHIQKGHGIAFADFDRDGDQDIYAVMGGAYEGDNFTNVLFENPISQNNWIAIELKGNKTNTDALGSRLQLELDNGQIIWRTVSSGGSFGASPIDQIIGLGQATQIKKLTVFWTNSAPQHFFNISPNQRIQITEQVESFRVSAYEPVPFAKNGSHKHVHH